MLNILAYTLAMIGVTATLALAEVMVCTQDNGRICTLAQSAKGGEVAVVVVGARVGDRLACTLEEGTVVCTKATRKSERDASTTKREHNARVRLPHIAPPGVSGASPPS
jgi:phosphatidylserine decarboxylase